MFFKNLNKYGNKIALIDCAIGSKLSYLELEIKTDLIVSLIGIKKELVFMEVKNTIDSVTKYIGCLKANKTVYLLEDLKDKKTSELIKLYQPNLIINGTGKITRTSNKNVQIHSDLAILLSTSGTTGTPKFVKLSAKNIQSNAESIVEYLKITSKDIALAHLKLHYSYGLSILHSHLEAGATTAFTDHNVIEDGFWDHLVDYSATSFAGVPYTFETLLQKKIDLKNYLSLRYVTQAGGKLEPSMVKKYAQKSIASGIEFFVMYGQTEAAPRISYLPPSFAFKYPHTIGRSIPNGNLFIIDEQGQKITEMDQPGELAYQGENIMMGYAEKSADLISDETPDILLTGDIACMTKHDLFYIVGRAKRFVKIFGLRINLDDVQSFVKKSYPQSAVTGNDDMIVIALESTDDVTKLITELSDYYSLPKNKFKIKYFKVLPLFSSGKYNFKAIMDGIENKTSLFQRCISKISEILELNENEWESITSLYESILGLDQVSTLNNFNSLSGDSLSYVSLAIELEHCLGEKMPDNWQKLSIAELDDIFNEIKLGS